MNLLSLALSTGLLAAVLAFAPHHPVAAQTSNDSHAGHHAGNTSADGTTELATGEVRRVSKDTNKITLRHGEIKSLDMPPMTMVFVVRDVSVLDTLKVGDKVRFAAEKAPDGSYVVTRIQPEP